MAVAFPSGYNLERTSTFTHDNNTLVDILDDGNPRQRVLGNDSFVTIKCIFRYVDSVDAGVLRSFLITNRDDTITWTIDGTDYSGVFVGGHQETMTGPLYNFSFVYRAVEV